MRWVEVAPVPTLIAPLRAETSEPMFKTPPVWAAARLTVPVVQLAQKLSPAPAGLEALSIKLPENKTEEARTGDTPFPSLSRVDPVKPGARYTAPLV